MYRRCLRDATDIPSWIPRQVGVAPWCWPRSRKRFAPQEVAPLWPAIPQGSALLLVRLVHRAREWPNDQRLHGVRLRKAAEATWPRCSHSSLSLRQRPIEVSVYASAAPGVDNRNCVGVRADTTLRKVSPHQRLENSRYRDRPWSSQGPSAAGPLLPVHARATTRTTSRSTCDSPGTLSTWCCLRAERLRSPVCARRTEHRVPIGALSEPSPTWRGLGAFAKQWYARRRMHSARTSRMSDRPT